MPDFRQKGGGGGGEFPAEGKMVHACRNSCWPTKLAVAPAIDAFILHTAKLLNEY